MEERFCYQWFPHDMSEEEIIRIENIINGKDYETFINYYKLYNSKGLINGKIEDEVFSYDLYFPIEILVVDKDDIITGQISLLSRENFEKITEVGVVKDEEDSGEEILNECS